MNRSWFKCFRVTGEASPGKLRNSKAILENKPGRVRDVLKGIILLNVIPIQAGTVEFVDDFGASKGA